MVGCIHPEWVLALSRLTSRTSDARLSLSFQDDLSNHQDPPLDELVYQEAMKILGLDTESCGGERMDGSNGMDEHPGVPQVR